MRNETKPRRMHKLFLSLTLLILVAAVALVWRLFGNLIQNYEDNVAAESAGHLVEINYQLQLYVEEKVERDWQVAYSVANSVSHSAQIDQAQLLDFLRRERQVWAAADIFVYTESGYCVSALGQVKDNDLASNTVAVVQRQGESMNIQQSTVTYTVPVEAELLLDGSPVAAVSVEQDLSTFLDNMEFSSFGGAAYLYLLADNGVIISRLSHPEAQESYNIMALLLPEQPVCLNDPASAVDTLLTSEQPLTYLLSGPAGSRYAVSTPIHTRQAQLRIIYIAPTSVVNSTMNSFSSDVTALSITVLTIFSLIAITAFVVIYMARKRQFDGALLARDRMFDLLVSNTQNAFSLLALGQKQPLYLSSNAHSLLGENALWLDRAEGCYRLGNTNGQESELTRRLNLQLATWDGKSEFSSDYLPYAAANGVRYLMLHIYPADNASSEFIVILQDITREREREEALRDALAMADSANAAKTRFLANMSHDIRTPMNAIVNMAGFALENDAEPETRREYLQTICESADHLLRLINDILDMSRIESGQAVAAVAPFSLRGCVQQVCEMIRPLATDKRQRFESGLDPACPDTLQGDELKIRQILINLLNNAVKFTPAGGSICFTVSSLPSLRPDFAALRFSVVDNGIGIAAELQPLIFQPFRRGEGQAVLREEGSGLGLSICKSYTTAMGGTLTCESQVGQGSRFTLELSLKQAAAPLPAPTPPQTAPLPSFQGKRALLCEDNPVNQIIAVKLLERLGFTVEATDNGQAGVERFLSQPPGYFDVIYMDIQMPVLDGYAATATLRRSDHPQARTIPIIAMTANVFVEDVERSRAAGMNGHVGKPIVKRELAQATWQALAEPPDN